jgi:hypothetical protein
MAIKPTKGQRAWQVVFCALAVAMLVGHLYCPATKVDAIAITLLVFAAVVWIWPTIKSLEFGGNKIELRDMSEAAKDFVPKSTRPAAGLIEGDIGAKASPASVQLTGSTVGATERDLKAVLETDPSLAVVGVGIEIEARLNALARRRGIDPAPTGAGRLLTALERAGVFTDGEAASLRRLIDLRNQAAHGASVSDDAGTWALEEGYRVVRELDRRIAESG